MTASEVCTLATLKTGSIEEWQHHRVGEKCRISDSLNLNLRSNQSPGWFVCTFKLEKYGYILLVYFPNVSLCSLFFCFSLIPTRFKVSYPMIYGWAFGVLWTLNVLCVFISMRFSGVRIPNFQQILKGDHEFIADIRVPEDSHSRKPYSISHWLYQKAPPSL